MQNIPLYRTDLQGAVHAVSDGVRWKITTELDERAEFKRAEKDGKRHD